MRCLSDIIRASNGFVGARLKKRRCLLLFSDVKDAGTGFIRSPYLAVSLPIPIDTVFCFALALRSLGRFVLRESYFSFGSTTSSLARRTPH